MSALILPRTTAGTRWLIFMLEGVPLDKSGKLSRIIDLDVDIGADAVDYKSVSVS